MKILVRYWWLILLGIIIFLFARQRLEKMKLEKKINDEVKENVSVSKITVEELTKLLNSHG